jgi:hypothetical protein
MARSVSAERGLGPETEAFTYDTQGRLAAIRTEDRRGVAVATYECEADPAAAPPPRNSAGFRWDPMDGARICAFFKGERTHGS